MSRAVGHHIVPRRYLSRFAEGGMITALHLDGGKVVPESVKRACRMNDFYTTTVNGVASDEIESRLAQAEAMLYPAFDEVDDGRWPLSPVGREQLSLWIALQYLRTRVIREIDTEVTRILVENDLNDEREAEFVASIRRKHPAADDRLLRNVFSAVRADILATGASANWQAQAIDQYAESMAAGLRHRCWVRYDFRRRGLVTSDEPVGLYRSTAGRVGIGNAGVVTFPLGRRVGIAMMAEPGPDQIRQATTSVARTLNQVTVNSAGRVIYHHPQDRPLEGVSVPTTERALSIDPRGVIAAADRGAPLSPSSNQGEAE